MMCLQYIGSEVIVDAINEPNYEQSGDVVDNGLDIVA